MPMLTEDTVVYGELKAKVPEDAWPEVLENLDDALIKAQEDGDFHNRRLSEAFTWMGSKQGYNYWYDLYRMLY